MFNEIPPQTPDFYLLRIPFVGEVRSPLPYTALFMAVLAAAACFTLPYAVSLTFGT